MKVLKYKSWVLLKPFLDIKIFFRKGNKRQALLLVVVDVVAKKVMNWRWWTWCSLLLVFVSWQLNVMYLFLKHFRASINTCARTWVKRRRRCTCLLNCFSCFTINKSIFRLLISNPQSDSGFEIQFFVEYVEQVIRFIKFMWYVFLLRIWRRRQKHHSKAWKAWKA